MSVRPKPFHPLNAAEPSELSSHIPATILGVKKKKKKARSRLLIYQLDSGGLFITEKTEKKHRESIWSLKAVSNWHVSGQSRVQGAGQKENIHLGAYVHSEFMSPCNFQTEQLW